LHSPGRSEARSSQARGAEARRLSVGGGALGTDEHPTMTVVGETLGQSRPGTLIRSIDVGTSAEAAVALLSEVEKWPVWLSFLRSARRLDTAPLGLGSEVALRSAIPGEEEQLYEVDRFLSGHLISLVGAFSIRRRLDFRVESKPSLARVVVRIDYPSYGGVLGALYDRITARRRLEAALADSLVHFKGLVEFGGPKDALLEDF
jgi:uncharacterized membrane protein